MLISISELSMILSHQKVQISTVTVETQQKPLQNITTKQGREGLCLPLCLQPPRRPNQTDPDDLTAAAVTSTKQAGVHGVVIPLAKILGSSLTGLHTLGDFQWAGAWQCKNFTFVALWDTKYWAWADCTLCFVNLPLSVTGGWLKGM